MNKLYRKSTVHPSPPAASEHILSFLPAAILALTTALSPVDREILAYLISCSSASFSNINRKGSLKASGASALGGSNSRNDHPPCFSCNCFRCYMSYWVKWDSSPNRQLIHEIIDAFEGNLLNESKKEKKEEKKKTERRKGKNAKVNVSAGILDERKSSETVAAESDINLGKSIAAAEGGASEAVGGGGAEEEAEKGSVRRFLSFLRERILSVWG